MDFFSFISCGKIAKRELHNVDKKVEWKVEIIWHILKNTSLDQTLSC